MKRFLVLALGAALISSAAHAEMRTPFTNPGGIVSDVSGTSVTPPGAATRTLAARAADALSVMDYGAFCDGQSHPLSGRFGSLAAAQAVYPAAVALTDEFDWVATQTAANAMPATAPSRLIFGRGKCLLNRDVTLPLGQRQVLGGGSGTTEIRFTGGSKGFAFENAGTADLLVVGGMAVSTSQAGVGRYLTVSFAGTAASTQQLVQRDVRVTADGTGWFEAADVLTNVRSPLYEGVFVTGSFSSPPMNAAHRYRGTTTDIRHVGGMVLTAVAAHDIGELCEGLATTGHIIIDADYGVLATFPAGKPWVEFTGGQVSAYKSFVKGTNIKQLHVKGGTHYAANYRPERMTGYIGFDLSGADTRNVLIQGAYFQGDGYTGTKALLNAANGAYGLVMGNQVSGFDSAWTLGANTNGWQVRVNQYLSVTTPWADSGTYNFHEFASFDGTARTVVGSGSFVEDLQGGSAATLRLTDRGSTANNKIVAFLNDDGTLYIRRVADDGSASSNILTGTSGGIQIGGTFSGNSPFRVGYGAAGGIYVYDTASSGQKQVTFGATDSAGTGFKTLRVPN
ncbi:hypothetical protein [Methylobacterium nonmethylotrophicum]|uniref:Uncharacterized protein n=1 Tax=Methylobacterium nonmethylotrophicum TaxID=1141884 RepID=A0A4Z0NF90_9HYPH|nr:hypothetical protein [Methylobacterium nonmethylotrophicum]TGD94056.1 hypothetical protein EU555_32560 [Methylobacterium nonmethylotrophicum]